MTKFKIGDAVRLSPEGRRYISRWRAYINQVKPSPDDIGWVVRKRGRYFVVRFASGAHNGSGVGWWVGKESLEKIDET